MRKYSNQARIHSLKTLTEKIYTIDIECPQIASQAKPGQFVQLKLPDIESSIWPRPFSIHKADNSLITISIKKFGKIFFRIEEEVRESFIKKMVLGFIFILLAVVIIFVLGITIIGAPIAVLLALFFVMALMVAGLIVSYTFGDWLLTKLKVTPSELVAFIVGFIIINLLFLIPVAGFLIQIVVVSLGFGAIFYAVKDNWETITAPRT